MSWPFRVIYVFINETVAQSNLWGSLITSLLKVQFSMTDALKRQKTMETGISMERMNIYADQCACFSRLPSSNLNKEHANSNIILTVLEMLIRNSNCFHFICVKINFDNP